MTLLTAKLLRLPVLAAVVCLCFAWVSEVEAQIGFQPTIDAPPIVVSGYDEIPNRLSVALIPKSYFVLDRRLIYDPKLESASFAYHSLRFTTDFYPNHSLVPMSIEADRYLAYRIRKFHMEEVESGLDRSITEARKGKGRSGLNIGLALPKRFDRMFGEGGGNLKVSGYRRITFSGRSNWQDGKSDLIKQSKFPSLNMDQIYRFDITGTIGTKITVKVSEDSKSEVPLANRIMIRYKGDDDDILKTIEAGNTNLSIPNTRFVGYSSRIQGLFGIKTEAQLGSFRFTGIASQEKGSAEKATVSGSGEEGAEYIRDYQYVEGRIFDLGYPNDFAPGDRVNKVYVYEFMKSLTGNEDQTPYDAKLTIYGDTLTEKSRIETIRVLKMDEDSYTLVNDARLQSPYIIFKTARYSSNALGVLMEVYRAAADSVETIGDDSGSVLILKSLRATPGNYTPTHPTWNLMWRNCYRIPKNVPVEDLNISIKRGKPKTETYGDNLEFQEEDGQNEGFYVEILGLDQVDNSNPNGPPDQLVDDNSDIYRSDLGLLIFPDRKPFAPSQSFKEGVNLRVPVPKLYTYNSPTEKTEDSEYYLQITSTVRSDVIRLNRANVIDGSERVTANGRPLERNVDYRVDYTMGTVTLISPEATDPNADVEVTFEYAPFLAIQKKTLLGMRAEYEWSRDLNFGATLLYKSDKAQDRKPRVGQETARMMVFDVDMSFTIRPSFFTKAVDALPLVTTEAASTIKVEGELARSYPNPNVDDVAYIDDFESSQDQASLGMTRGVWREASQPLQINDAWQRTRMLWHNPIDRVDIDSIYIRDTRASASRITLFRMIFRPDTSGVPSWAGIQRFFQGRIDADRVQLMELRVRGNRGRLHFDFGRISEDINGDGLEFTEDSSGVTQNEIYDYDPDTGEDLEDKGLDGLFDRDEPGYDAATLPDPNGDNWYFQGLGKPPIPISDTARVAQLQRSVSENDNRSQEALYYYYEWLNGTEGNKDDLSMGGKPDHERMGYSFSQENAYFSTVVDLEDPTWVVDSATFEVAGSDKPWRTFRVPILDSTALETYGDLTDSGTVLEPNWGNISHVRVWFEGDGTYTEPDTIELAAWYFVQTNWQDSIHIPANVPGVSNTELVVATVSEEDGTFSAPPGVEPYEDPVEGTAETQRGLAMIYSDLRWQDTCLATKKLISVENYTGYRYLEMYVNGKMNDSNMDSVLFFYRLGENDSTFYEYRSETPLKSGWDLENHVRIDFNEITALKDSAQQALPKGVSFRNVNTPPVGKYRVVGDPNISRISYFAAGLVNLSHDREISGEVWMDELRVTGVRKDVGTAGRVSLSGNMADLINYSFNYESKDPYFRGLAKATRGGGNNSLGSGRDDKSYSWNTSLNVHKFLPRSLGARLPISFSYSKSVQTPVLRTRSDVILPESVREEEKSVSETRSFRVSEGFNRKGSNPLFNLLLNRQSVSFSYSRTKQTSVTRPYYMGENYGVKADYDMSWSKPPSVPIFFWLKPIPFFKKAAESRLSLYPTTWKWAGQFNRSASITDDIDNKRTSTYSRGLTASMNINYKMFDNLTTTYAVTSKSDLSDPDGVKISFSDFRLGLETNYSQNFSANYDPKLFGFLNTKWTYSAKYSESWERSSKTKKSDLNRTWGVSGNFNHIAFLGGRSGRGSGGSAAGRTNQRGGGAKAASGGGRPFYDPPLALLRLLTGWIDAPSYKYNESYFYSLPGMVARPSWKYRFGMIDVADVDTVTVPYSQSSRKNQNYEVSSGFKLLGGITTTIKFRQSVSRDLVKLGALNKSVSTGWPELSIRIQRFKTLPVIKGVVNKFIDVFAPKTGYSRQVKEDFNLDDGFRTQRNISQSFSPLLSINFKLLQALSFSGSYTLAKSSRETYGRTDGVLDKETRSTKKTIAFSAKYAFSSPSGISLPLFGKLRFKSEVNISVNVRKTSSLSEMTEPGQPWQITENKSEISISPVIAYNFSRSVKGGLTGRWQDHKDTQGIGRHMRSLEIWAEISF